VQVPRQGHLADPERPQKLFAEDLAGVGRYPVLWDAAIAEKLIQALDIRPEDLIQQAYIDLMR
jgi:hypothetical protein